MDKNQKQRFTKLVDFLGKALGENYEVVLHDISEKGSSIVAITNNHISNRTANSPLTGFALDLLKSGAYKDKDFIVDYKAATKGGKSIQGSTFFIKENDKILGMLCINHDDTAYKDMADQILKLGNIHEPKSKTIESFTEAKVEVVEYLSESIEDIIATIIDPSFLNDKVSIRPEKKQKIINALFEKGIFNIKGAVLQVAEVLNMSEQSVYRYLKKVGKSS